MKSQLAISTSNSKCSESALVRWRLWRERFPELLSDLKDFLRTSSIGFEDSPSGRSASSDPSGSQSDVG